MRLPKITASDYRHWRSGLICYGVMDFFSKNVLIVDTESFVYVAAIVAEVFAAVFEDWSLDKQSDLIIQ